MVIVGVVVIVMGVEVVVVELKSQSRDFRNRQRGGFRRAESELRSQIAPNLLPRSEKKAT